MKIYLQHPELPTPSEMMSNFDDPYEIHEPLLHTEHDDGSHERKKRRHWISSWCLLGMIFIATYTAVIVIGLLWWIKRGGVAESTDLYCKGFKISVSKLLSLINASSCKFGTSIRY